MVPVALHTAFAVLIAFVDENLTKNFGISMTIVGKSIEVSIEFALT